MRQAELNRAVAQATGESVSTIKRLGFLLASPEDLSDPSDADLGPFVIDWDVLEAERQLTTNWSPSDAPAVA